MRNLVESPPDSKQTDNTKREEPMSQLIVRELRSPKKTMLSDEEAAKIRRQVDLVLEKHRDDLPREIITQLKSPMLGIVKLGLRDAASWIQQHTADLKQQWVQRHPECKKAVALKARANAVLNGEFGIKAKESLDARGRRILELDLFQILDTEQLGSLKAFVKQLEAAQGRLRAAKERKQMSLEELFPPKERRERKPKPATPAYTGLPPVRTDSTDMSFLEAKPYAEVAKKDYVVGRTQAGTPQRGAAVHNPKNHNKGKKQG